MCFSTQGKYHQCLRRWDPAEFAGCSYVLSPDLSLADWQIHRDKGLEEFSEELQRLLVSLIREAMLQSIHRQSWGTGQA